MEHQRRSVCVLAADLNAGEGGGRGGGGGVMHTIHGLCHLCIRCRLPQVCVCDGEKGVVEEEERKQMHSDCARETLCLRLELL